VFTSYSISCACPPSTGGKVSISFKCTCHASAYTTESKEAAQKLKEHRGQRAVLTRFAGFRAEIEYIKFFRENDSEVKYNVYFSDKPSTPSNPNCMGFMIRPVRLEGKWYLTLAGENQATFSSQINSTKY
jgi:hypothetical protein